MGELSPKDITKLWVEMHRDFEYKEYAKAVKEALANPPSKDTTEYDHLKFTKEQLKQSIEKKGISPQNSPMVLAVFEDQVSAELKERDTFTPSKQPTALLKVQDKNRQLIRDRISNSKGQLDEADKKRFDPQGHAYLTDDSNRIMLAFHMQEIEENARRDMNLNDTLIGRNFGSKYSTAKAALSEVMKAKTELEDYGAELSIFREKRVTESAAKFLAKERAGNSSAIDSPSPAAATSHENSQLPKLKESSRNK